jgi:hypothetical protein
LPLNSGWPGVDALDQLCAFTTRTLGAIATLTGATLKK